MVFTLKPNAKVSLPSHHVYPLQCDREGQMKLTPSSFSFHIFSWGSKEVRKKLLLYKLFQDCNRQSSICPLFCEIENVTFDADNDKPDFDQIT